MNAKCLSDGPNFVHEFLEEDLEFLVERLIGAGLKRIIAVDLTKPEFGIPVVRVVIPNLEGPSQQAGYIPGARAARANAR
jgi:ribosomal protein S12 methylthiotransferase accessory factor